MTSKPKDVDEYINAFPDPVQKKLNELRSILKEVAPDATEELKWGKPVFVEKRILFSFAGFKNHMMFMPTGPSLEPFKDELKDYKTGKDTVQFSYDQPIPKELITKIAKYRRTDVLENGALWMY